MFIGKYNKSVVVTYLGVAFAILAMNFVFKVELRYTMIFMALAGLCDLFDGKIARMCKRDESEKDFGVQIDSLADIVSYVVLPITIGYSMGLSNWYNIIIYILFVLAGIIRLGFFNISVCNSNKDIPVRSYKGLPVTSTSIIIPFVWLLSRLVKFPFKSVFSYLLFIMAFLFIINIRVPKFRGIAYLIISIIAILSIIFLLLI